MLRPVSALLLLLLLSASPAAPQLSSAPLPAPAAPALTPAQLAELLPSTRFALVALTAAWCPHSGGPLQAELAGAAAHLAASGRGHVLVASVDASTRAARRELAGRVNLRAHSFPALLWLVDGAQAAVCDAPRSAPHLAAWVEAHASAPVVLVPGADEARAYVGAQLDQAAGGPGWAVVGAFAPADAAAGAAMAAAATTGAGAAAAAAAAAAAESAASAPPYSWPAAFAAFSAAAVLLDHTFGLATAPPAWRALGLDVAYRGGRLPGDVVRSAQPLITMLRNFDGETRSVVFPLDSAGGGAATSVAIASWVAAHSAPLLSPLTAATAGGGLLRGLPSARVVAMLPPGGEPPGSGQPPRELAAALRSAAAASRAAGVRARFFYLDTARTDAAGFLSAYWGAGPGGPGTAPAAPPPWFPPLPAVVAYGADAEGAPPGGAPSRKYRLPAPAAAGPHTAESLAAFAAAAASGALPAWRLSAPPPPPHPRPPPPGAVAAVVGDSFGELVLDPARDVLLAVTAAWCAHCAAAAPVLAALARRFAPVPSVRVATFDAAANEHEALAGLLAGYPGFLLWPAGDPKPAPAAYDQAAPRTLAALTRFVKRHATVPYELPRRGAAAAAAAAGAQAERTEDERAPAALRDGGTTAAVAEAGHDEL